MSRDRAGHVNRTFLGMKVLGETKIPAGTKIFRNGSEVGIVTSSGFSPRLGCPIALGYLKRGSQDLGLQLETAAGNVEVLGWPPLPKV